MGRKKSDKESEVELERELNEEFDFDNAVRNPYAKQLKKQITIKLSVSTIDYFQKQSQDVGIPYQTLINLYLDNCVKEGKKLDMHWV